MVWQRISKPPKSFLKKVDKYISLIKADRAEELNVDEMDFIEQLAFRRAVLKSIFEEGVYDNVFDNLYKKILVELRGGQVFKYDPFVDVIAEWWYNYRKSWGKKRKIKNKTVARLEVDAALSTLKYENLVKERVLEIRWEKKDRYIGIGPCFTLEDTAKYILPKYDSRSKLPLPLEFKNEEFTGNKLGKTKEEEKLSDCRKIAKLLDQYYEKDIIDDIKQCNLTSTRYGVYGIEFEVKDYDKYDLRVWVTSGGSKTETKRLQKRYERGKKLGLFKELAHFSDKFYFVKITPLGRYVEDILNACSVGWIDNIDTKGDSPSWETKKQK